MLVSVAPPPTLRRMRTRALAILLAAACAVGAAEPEPGPEAPPAAATITLPATCDLGQLVQLVAEMAELPVQYDASALARQVPVAPVRPLTAAEAWSTLNRILLGNGFTTVLVGNPPVMQVVPVAEAAGLGSALTAEGLDALAFPPGSAVVLVPVRHLPLDQAVKAVGTLMAGQVASVRSLPELGSLIIAGSVDRIQETRALLARLDTPAGGPAIALFRPARTSPGALQAAALQAWAAMGRTVGADRAIDVQIAPDGQQVLLIARAQDLPLLEKLVGDLDRSEPVETRPYRPRYFGLDDVAGLLQQLLRSDPGAASIALVRDQLTGSLMITGTRSQHERVAKLLTTLDEAPASARRQVRAIPVKHRQVEELAQVLGTLLRSGAAQAQAGTDGQPAPAPVPAPTTTTESTTPGATATTGAPGGVTPNQVPTVTTTSTTIEDAGVTVATDPPTNRLICVGEPMAIDQIVALVQELDRRQVQVELEITLVTISETQSRDLGIELLGQIQRGEVSALATSLFGLSTPVANSVSTQLDPRSAGLSGLVLNPGDYAGVIRALERVTSGRSLIRSNVVVANNAKATINGVVQEPITSINSGSQVATTTYAGTSDAGTQVTLQPQISAADYVTLSYSVSQSAFLGQPTITADGGSVPPTKRTDSLASLATVPDGHVIALGGLSNRGTNDSESRLPWVGSVPILGQLFKSQSRGQTDSRFYVFIKASVLRHGTFADLRRITDGRTGLVPQAGVGRPRLEPQFLK